MKLWRTHIVFITYTLMSSFVVLLVMVSLILMLIMTSCASFWRPKATAPLVIRMHSRPSFCSSDI